MEVYLICISHAILIFVVSVAHLIITTLLWILIDTGPHRIWFVQAVSEIEVILSIIEILFLLRSNRFTWNFSLYSVFILCVVGSFGFNCFLLFGIYYWFFLFQVFSIEGELWITYLLGLRLYFLFRQLRWTALSRLLCGTILLWSIYNLWDLLYYNLVISIFFVTFYSDSNLLYVIPVNGRSTIWLSGFKVSLRST